ncbi:FG-GAP repeat domain-containing protein [Paenarthrobacter sp. 2TAF44]|uniref:FG-GAP repeat domain-containing protein n=1 Tax=Paenarthrobacter sp. 2TAF44 TaxID=3233018 RepID=UPI003F958FEE
MRRISFSIAALLVFFLAAPAVAAPARADDSWHNFIQIWWDWDVVYSDLLVVEGNGDQWVYEGKPNWETQLLTIGHTVIPDADALLLPGDWDGDGYADWLYRHADGGLHVRGGLKEGHGSAYISQIGWGWDVMTALTSPGDWDGDGAPDVLARDSSGALWTYRGDGTGGWIPGRTQVGWGWNIMTSIFSGHDFSGDGVPDVIARDTNGNLWLYPGNGTGGWKPRLQIGWGWTDMDLMVAPGDFDYDGYGDVIAKDGAGAFWLYPGNGSGGFTFARRQIDIIPSKLLG